MDFMTWFLNALHGALGGTKKKPCEYAQSQRSLNDLAPINIK